MGVHHIHLPSKNMLQVQVLWQTPLLPSEGTDRYVQDSILLEGDYYVHLQREVYVGRHDLSTREGVFSSFEEALVSILGWSSLEEGSIAEVLIKHLYMEGITVFVGEGMTFSYTGENLIHYSIWDDPSHLLRAVGEIKARVLGLDHLGSLVLPWDLGEQYSIEVLGGIPEYFYACKEEWVAFNLGV